MFQDTKNTPLNSFGNNTMSYKKLSNTYSIFLA